MKKGKKQVKHRFIKFEKPSIILLLVVLWLATGFNKVKLYQQGTHFKTESDFCLFRVEEALRYQYAKLVSDGEKIPERDIAVQYPEGLEVKKHIPLTSEVFIGKLYRMLPLKNVPFHIFLVYFMFFFSSLNVFAIYLFAWKCTGNRWAPFAAVIFYVTAFPSFARTITGGLVEEDFALFLIFMSYWFFLVAVEEDKFIFSIPAGLFLFIPLSSWHGTQFAFLLLLVYVVFEFFVRPEKHFTTETRKEKGESGEREKKHLLGLKDWTRNFIATENTKSHGDYRRNNLIKSFAVMVGFNIAAGLIFAVLKTEYFIFSYAMLIAYALILTYVFQQIKFLHNKWFGIPLFLGICVLLLLVIAPLVQEHSADYGHIYALVINKIRYLGKKPLFAKTVEQLSFDTKIMWQSSNVSPSLEHVKSNFLWIFVAGILGLLVNGWKFFRRRLSFLKEGIFYFTIVFFIYYLLIRRMYVFEIFFLPVFVSESIMVIWNWRTRRQSKIYLTGLLTILLGSCCVFQVKQSRAAIPGVARRIPENRQEVIRWIKNNTPREAVILADIGISPEIITFAERKCILHNFFETTEIRRKTESFYRALFKPEKEFWEYCQKYQAGYVVYNWNWLLNVSADSIRYQVDAYRVHRNETCYLFNFEPENLKYFTLLWQSNHYRIYKVEKEPVQSRFEKNTLQYVPFFNKRLFVEPNKEIWIEGDTQGPIFDDDYAQERMQKVWEMPKVLARAKQYRQEGKYTEALAEYKKNVEADPYMPQARLSLGEFFLFLERYDEAIKELNRAINLDPNLVQGYYFLGIALANRGERKEAIDVFKQGLKLAPGNKYIKESLKDTLSLPQK